ncbi:MAG: hypothetical protein NSGCLCUN01_00922 [uncultured Clostridium sp.]
MVVKIPFGKRENEIVHISQITNEERGIKCNCVCVNCGERLVAKIGGNKKTRHFAHYKECICNGGLESALHLFAKDIFNKRKEIMIPSLYIKFCNYSFERSDIEISSKEGERAYFECTSVKKNEDYDYLNISYDIKKICRGQKLKFDKVEIEKVIGYIKPDIILSVSNRKLLVEIAVTHFIDDKKRDKINKKGLSTIEIDLSEYKEKFNILDKKYLEDIIVNKVENKGWIYNEKCEKVIEYILQKNIYQYEKMKERIKRDIKIKKEQGVRKEKLRELKIKNEENKKLREQKELNNKFEQLLNNKKEILKTHRNELFKTKIWQKIKDEYDVNENNIPKLIDIEVRNEVIFKIDRVIWQYLIFSRKISKEKCIWINDIVKFVKVNIPMHNELINYDLGDRVDEAINEYIDRLVNFGVVELRSKKGVWGKSFIVLNSKFN